MTPSPRPKTRPEFSRARFLTPERQDRPAFRWWWTAPTPVDELCRELRAMKEAGFGEVEIAFSPGFWADDAQREALAAVLAEAERIDIGVAATAGAAWPLQTPNTTRGTEHAAKELQYGVTWVSSGHEGAVEVAAPFDDPVNARGAVLHAVTAARVVERGDGPSLTEVPHFFGPRIGIVPPERSTVLDPDSLMDLSDAVVDGRVEFSATAGEWALVALWLRDCEQGVTSFLDRDAAVAATTYLDEHQFGSENLAAFGRIGTEWFEDSLELNADSLFWTTDLLQRFEDRHGYDLRPFLPLLFAHGMCRYWVPNEEPTPDFALPDGADARVRHDYYALMTDLYIADHLLVLQEWSERHGVKHKAQVAYGQNLEPIRSNRVFVRHGGRAEGESLNSGDRAPVDPQHPNWRFALDWQRCIVGGAHQGGAVRISTELGAQFGTAFQQSLGDLQEILDKEWAAGITKPFVHGFAAQPPDASWPTHSRFHDFVAESWNDQQFPEWRHLPALADYWARGTVVLETGIPRTDVAILRDGFLTTSARGMGAEDATAPAHLVDTLALEQTGYTVHYVDPPALTEPGAAGGTTLFPDGPAYRALVIDDTPLPPAAAEAIDAAASEGLRVLMVGGPPHRAPGFTETVHADERVRAAMARLSGRETVRKVTDHASLPTALLELGVRPHVATNGAWLLTQWRETPAADYIVVYNPSPEALTVELDLEGSGVLTRLDLWTGDAAAVPAVADAGRTAAQLRLAGLELCVLELDRAPVGETQSATPQERESVTVELSAWDLDVDSYRPEGVSTIRLPGQGPSDWREVPALADVSGIGRYRTVFQGPELEEAVLDLGELHGSARILVRGQQIATVFTSGRQVQLGHLRPGDEMVLEVATVLNNAVTTLDRPGLPPSFGISTERATIRQGLIGPVMVSGPAARDREEANVGPG